EHFFSPISRDTSAPMNARALRAVFYLGAFYAVPGILLGMLARQAHSTQVRIAWRWTAWVASGLAFGAQIVYEQLRLRSSPTITACRVAAAAALGAFGLAVAANIHAQLAAPPQPSRLLALSLAIWPAMTALAAFAVALVAAILFARARERIVRFRV